MSDLEDYRAVEQLAKKVSTNVVCNYKKAKGETGKAGKPGSPRASSKPASSRVPDQAKILAKYAELQKDPSKTLNAKSGSLLVISKLPGNTSNKNYAYDSTSRVGAIASAEGEAAVRNAATWLGMPQILANWYNSRTPDGRVVSAILAQAQAPAAAAPLQTMAVQPGATLPVQATVVMPPFRA